MSFNNRSDALIELLEELTQQGHEYVLVGGYAVSAFNARFSTNLDIVVAPDSKADFVEFLATGSNSICHVVLIVRENFVLRWLLRLIYGIGGG
jgi:hypothetical protein